MCRMPGTWTSFDHLEESLSVDELSFLLNQAVELENERREFAANIQGIDLRAGGSSAENRFEQIKERAEAKARGMSEEAYSFAVAGFGYEEVD